jgi:eukaryotic-like serine/threonine-protein kinase
MGVVWRARDQILDRDVAVKEVVISSLLGEEERRNAYQRTLREARTAARLSHRGLVAVYDVAEEDGRPWIVMELVPSRSLDQVLTVEGRLPPLRVARIGQQLLSALAAAHLAGVLHRDVKPSNVLIATDRTGTGWDERAVLTDFGIAQFEGDPRLTQTGMVMGSPGFTAPERIRGGDATHASDLWSLGATLYAAVEGRGPYEQRGGAITTMSAIINEDAPIATHAGRLAQVIAALLRREPAARPSAPTAARMFAHVLSSLATSEDASPAAHPPTVISKRIPPPAAPVRSASVAPPADAAASDAAATDTPASKSSPESAAADTLAPTDAAVPAVAAAAAVAPTSQVDSAPALALPSAAPAAGTTTPASETPTEPSSAEASAPNSAEADEGAAAAEPEASTPAAAAPEAEAPAAAGEEEAAEEEPPTPLPDARADAAAMADEAEAAAARDADAQESAVEVVSAVEAVSAIEPLKMPDDGEDADVPVAIAELADAAEAVDAVDAAEPVSTGEPVSAGEPVDAVESAEASAGQSGAGNTAIDPGTDGQRPAERSTPAARTATPKPKPSPSFTAARPGERGATPTFSAARPGTPTVRSAASNSQRSGHESAQPQYGAAQYGAARYESAQPDSAPYGANLYGGNSYGGPGAPQPGGTTPYLDQSIQYTPGTGGGRGQRRLRPRWRLILVICAVLVAAAIGAGTAIALGHHGPAATAGTHNNSATAASTRFKTVNALNEPSSAVPAGWVPAALQPSAAKTNAGFSLSLPPGWTEQRKGLGTYFHGPRDMLLEIDLTPHKYPNDMVQEAKSVEQGAETSGNFPQYRRAALTGVPVRGTKGAFLQFTWSLDGVGARTDDILFVLPTSNGSQSYAVYVRGLNSDWNSRDLPVFDEILQTFQTIPPSA